MLRRGAFRSFSTHGGYSPYRASTENGPDPEATFGRSGPERNKPSTPPPVVCAECDKVC